MKDMGEVEKDIFSREYIFTMKFANNVGRLRDARWYFLYFIGYNLLIIDSMKKDIMIKNVHSPHLRMLHTYVSFLYIFICIFYTIYIFNPCCSVYYAHIWFMFVIFFIFFFRYFITLFLYILYKKGLLQ